MRLGHAETDEQLQDIISKFLPPVLLKLSSVQEGVRKKVSVCEKTVCSAEPGFAIRGQWKIYKNVCEILF